MQLFKKYRPDETIKKYYQTIIKGGAKEFISNYDYYFTLFSMVDLIKTEDPKQTEENFINSINKEINSQLNEKTHIYFLNDKDKAMDETEHTLSQIYLYHRLYKIRSKKTILSNPYKRIFSSDFAFNFFEQLRQTVTNDLADYSFIYRKMLSENLIYETIGDSEFRRWLSSKYEVEIDKTKQLHICRTHRKEQLYTTIKSTILK